MALIFSLKSIEMMNLLDTKKWVTETWLIKQTKGTCGITTRYESDKLLEYKKKLGFPSQQLGASDVISTMVYPATNVPLSETYNLEPKYGMRCSLQIAFDPEAMVIYVSIAVTISYQHPNMYQGA